MSLGNKYNTCSSCNNTNKSKTYKSCSCSSPVVSAPTTPCAVAHETKYSLGVCLYVSCEAVANGDSSGFYLTFREDTTYKIPNNFAHVYFYHQSAGLIQVIGKLNQAYHVKLVDTSREGAVISPNDCIMVTVNVGDFNSNGSQRCVVGNFTVPSVGALESIYIFNGAGIPLGGTITFTVNGVAGSYVINSFVNASNNTYVYKVQNTGSGHTPGTIIDGGAIGNCSIPVEVITDINICSLATTSQLDSVIGCNNNAPSALIPTGEGDILVGTAGKKWELKKITNFDCCVVIDGCLKFSGPVCPSQTDSVVLRTTNIDCFEEAYNEAIAANQKLAMNINGFPVIVTNYVSGTRTATFSPAEDTNLPLTAFDAGTQICIGDCCSSCISEGNKITSVTTPSSGETSPLQGLGGTISVPAGDSYWLFGLDNTTSQTQQFLQLTAPYFASVGTFVQPQFSDPMVIRQKIENNSKYGCDQVVKLNYNYNNLYFEGLPSGAVVNWELASYATQSLTLGDDVTANPFSTVSTQSKVSGTLVGPSITDATLVNSSFGPGNSGQAKVFPFAAGEFSDTFVIEKCNAVLSVVWFFAKISSPLAANLRVSLAFRRILEFTHVTQTLMPNNKPQISNWKP